MPAAESQHPLTLSLSPESGGEETLEVQSGERVAAIEKRSARKNPLDIHLARNNS